MPNMKKLTPAQKKKAMELREKAKKAKASGPVRSYKAKKGK